MTSPQGPGPDEQNGPGVPGQPDQRSRHRAPGPPIGPQGVPLPPGTPGPGGPPGAPNQQGGPPQGGPPRQFPQVNQQLGYGPPLQGGPQPGYGAQPGYGPPPGYGAQPGPYPPQPGFGPPPPGWRPPYPSAGLAQFGPNGPQGPFASTPPPTPPTPRKSRTTRTLELQTRQLTDTSAALARKLRSDLMLSVLQPMLRGHPPWAVAERLLTALDHLNMTTGGPDTRATTDRPMWLPPRQWAHNLDPSEKGIPLWERLRRLGRVKGDPVYEWEICYALYKWATANIPGHSLAQKKWHVRNDPRVAQGLHLDPNYVDRMIERRADFARDWSLRSWWDEQLARRGQGSVYSPEARAHEWDHPGLTASRIVRTDFARQLLQKDGIELGVIGGKEAFGVSPPSAGQLRQIFAGAAPEMRDEDMRAKLQWASSAINWGIGPKQEGNNDTRGVAKHAEARLAKRVGKYRERVKSVQEQIDKSRTPINLTNPSAINYRTDRIGEILQVAGAFAQPFWYGGTIMQRADLLLLAIAGSVTFVAGTGLKYGLRGIRGLREKGMPPQLANLRLRRAEKAHEEAMDRLYKANSPGDRSRGFFRRK